MVGEIGTNSGGGIERQRLCDQVAGRIQEGILTGSLKSGDMLPAEKALVTQFGVSRTVIREAINKLATKGLIHVTHGKGATITPRENWKLIDADLLNGLSHSLVELLELRKMLEVEAAGLTAERATDEDLQAIGEAFHKYQEASSRPEGRTQEDLDFHAAIIRATKNHLLVTILDPISDMLRLSRVATLNAHRNKEGRERGTRAHTEIWEALQKRDAAKARLVMRRHLDEVEDDFRAVGIL